MALPVISVAGLPLPLDNTFDFAAWSTIPDDMDIPAHLNIKARNKWNSDAETHNSTSIQLTRNYEAALSATAPANATTNIDVGRPLMPNYQYTALEIEMMVSNQHFCESVGPLPIAMLEYVVIERMKREDLAKQLKEKKDKEREDKEKEKTKGTPLSGSVVTLNPLSLSSIARPVLEIPVSFLTSLAHRKFLPLHWFSDENLKKANFAQEDIFMEKITPETKLDATSNPDKVHVVSLSKMIPKWGNDKDTTHLTTHTFDQSSRNLLRAWDYLCGTNAPPPTIASNLKLHIEFFTGLEAYESAFSIWYTEERRLRMLIFQHYQFDETKWTTEVGGILNAHRAVALIQGTKRAHEGEHQQVSNKVHKPHSDSAPSGPRDDANSGRGRDPPTGPRVQPSGRSPACLLCADTHTIRGHTDGPTHFRNPKGAFFCERKGRTLWTKGSVPEEVCIIYNLNSKTCDGRHGPSRIHICSLCGGTHPALSRSSECARVLNGEFRP